MRRLAIDPLPPFSATRRSVIFRSEGLDARETFWVVWAIVSSTERCNNPPRATPPRAAFLRKLRRSFVVEGLFISALIASLDTFSSCLCFSAICCKIVFMMLFLVNKYRYLSGYHHIFNYLYPQFIIC